MAKKLNRKVLNVLLVVAMVLMLGAIITNVSDADCRYVEEHIRDEDGWDTEGGSALRSIRGCYYMRFDPLDTEHTTSSAAGFRHEYKIELGERKSMYDTDEYFEAKVKMKLSDGAKVIIAQYNSKSGVLMKLYVGDTDENHDDGKPSNGVFDVYVRVRDTNGKEKTKALGTVKRNEEFKISIDNNDGNLKISALGGSYKVKVKDGSKAYLKFGSYLLSVNDKDKSCGDKGNKSDFRKCYDNYDIEDARVYMYNIKHNRDW